MKTTIGKSAVVVFSGTTTWIDKNGKELYTIWSDGCVSIYGPTRRLTMELDQRGTVRLWSNKLRQWVEVNTT